MPGLTPILTTVIAQLLILLTSTTPHASASESKVEKQKQTPSLSYEHTPVSSTVAGKNTIISAHIRSKHGIAEARLYFKIMSANWYFFLPMEKTKKEIYSATLPPVKNDTKGIDYIVLVKDDKGNTTKSRPYRALVHNDYNYPPSERKQLNVYSELETSPVNVDGFTIAITANATPEPLLAGATLYKYPPIDIPGSKKKSKSFLSGPGGVAAAITLGGFGISYKGSGGK